jgi:hypothetical protein
MLNGTLHTATTDVGIGLNSNPEVKMFSAIIQIRYVINGTISGSHGDEFEDGRLLECSTA